MSIPDFEEELSLHRASGCRECAMMDSWKTDKPISVPAALAAFLWLLITLPIGFAIVLILSPFIVLKHMFEQRIYERRKY